VIERKCWSVEQEQGEKSAEHLAAEPVKSCRRRRRHT